MGNGVDYLAYPNKSTQHLLLISKTSSVAMKCLNQSPEVPMIHASRNQQLRFAICLTLLATAGLLLAGRTSFAADADIPHLEAAAERGNLSQEVQLASAYVKGNGVAQDMTRAAYWFQKAAEGGDPAAQNEIGCLYMTGSGVPADSTQAFHWYQLSAASGLVQAKVNLALLYFWGDGVRQDIPLAAQLFQDAVSKGDGTAATYLGNMYYFGHGVVQDKATAEKWFVTGVKMHDPIAAFNLGLLNSGKDDHARDLPKAARLLRRSASAGFVPAMYSLGVLAERHPELAQSSQEAGTLLTAAARAGSWKASVALGMLARDSANPVEAYYHFHVAALQGGDEAKALVANDLRKLSASLTAQQVAMQIAAASGWFAEHPSALAFVYKDGEGWKQFLASPLTAEDHNLRAGRALSLPPA